MRCFLIALLILYIANPASAQVPSCAPRAEMLKTYKETYGETVVGLGVDFRGGLLQILTSPKGKTWTMMVSRPSGETCVVGHGEDWQALPFPIAEEES